MSSETSGKVTEASKSAAKHAKLPTLAELVPRYVESLIGGPTFSGLLTEAGAGIGSPAEILNMVVSMASALAKETIKQLKEEASSG